VREERREKREERRDAGGERKAQEKFLENVLGKSRLR
jgi:hypothetical protein